MDKPFSFETFLRILENDDHYAVDETSFYFDDDPDEKDRMLGCLRDYEKPYWVGYCDITDGCEFYTAKEMLDAKIFDGRSIRERWEHTVFTAVGGIGIEDWLDTYKDEIKSI